MRRLRTDFLEWAKSKGPNEVLSHSSVDEPTIRDAVNAAYHTQKFQNLLNEDNEWGLEELKTAIAHRYGVVDNREQPTVLLTPGASNAIYDVCRTFLTVGAEVIVEMPCYEPIKLVVEAFRAVVVAWPRKNDTYGLYIDNLPSLITPRTKLVILSNPHNPTGVATTQNELLHIVEVIGNRDIRIMVDEIFLDNARDATQVDLSHEGSEIVPAASLKDERIVSIGGLSKVYGLSRIRTGWILGTPGTIRELRPWYKIVINIGCLDTEAVSAILFSQLDDFSARSQDIVSANRELLRAEFATLLSRGVLSGLIPTHGCTCFPKVPWLATLEDSHADKVMEDLETQCGVVPGGFFGSAYHDHIRIGLGGPTDVFAGAVRKLCERLEHLSKGHS